MKLDLTARPPDPDLARVTEIDSLRAELAKRDVAIIELRQALDAAAGPHCPSCGNSIDPDMCHCGTATSDPGHDNHTPVPMGCVCGYLEPDWQALATTRGEHMHRLRVEIARLTRTTDLGIAVADARRLRAERDRLRDELARLEPLRNVLRSWDWHAIRDDGLGIVDEMCQLTVIGAFVRVEEAEAKAKQSCGVKVVPGREFPGPHFVCELPRGHGGDHRGQMVDEPKEQADGR